MLLKDAEAFLQTRQRSRPPGSLEQLLAAPAARPDTGRRPWSSCLWRLQHTPILGAVLHRDAARSQHQLPASQLQGFYVCAGLRWLVWRHAKFGQI